MKLAYSSFNSQQILNLIKAKKWSNSFVNSTAIIYVFINTDIDNGRNQEQLNSRFSFFFFEILIKFLGCFKTIFIRYLFSFYRFMEHVQLQPENYINLFFLLLTMAGYFSTILV